MKSYPLDLVSMRKDKNVGVRNALHTTFDLAADRGLTPGNGSLNQEGTTFLRTNGAMASTKVVVSMNKLVYFIKTHPLEVS